MEDLELSPRTEARIAYLQERRKDAIVPAAIYYAAAAYFMIQACGANLGIAGTQHTGIKEMVGLGFATAGALYNTLYLKDGDEIRALQQSNETE